MLRIFVDHVEGNFNADNAYFYQTDVDRGIWGYFHVQFMGEPADCVLHIESYIQYRKGKT